MTRLHRYRHALLDVDGTLVDSNDAHARAWVTAFSEHGFPVEPAYVRRLIGMGGDRLIPAATGLDEDDPAMAGLSDRRTRLFLERELPSVRPFPRVRALLERLRHLGLSLTVATSARREELDALLAVAGVADLLSGATTADDADASKPAPDIVCAALERAGARPGVAVMLGDTPYDIVAATRAGVDIVAMRCGGWTDEALAGALAVYDSPADLLARLDRSPLSRARPAASHPM